MANASAPILGNVPVRIAAKLMQKKEQFVRIGLQRQLLPFGTAIQLTKGRYSYHISPGQFCRYMGIDLKELEVAINGKES